MNATLSRTIKQPSNTAYVNRHIYFRRSGDKRLYLALMIGILVGTYSSIFVAASLMYDTSPARLKQALPNNMKNILITMKKESQRLSFFVVARTIFTLSLVPVSITFQDPER
jgi:hypothetical protein